jgi:hypothetical protein
MTTRSIPRAAIKTTLRVARTPLDAATLLLPGAQTGARNSARLTIDRLDAAALRMAGQITLDPGLIEDARIRRQALTERAKATRLRDRAERIEDEGANRLEESREQASRQRARADQKAKARREQAARERKLREAQATEAENLRKRRSRQVEAQREERIAEEVPKQRLEVVEEQAQAQVEREKALAERDEAGRLAAAAGRAKEDRKEG